MTRKTQNKISKIFKEKLEEVRNLNKIYKDFHNLDYPTMAKSIDLNEIDTLEELKIFQMMVDAYSTVVLEFFFDDTIKGCEYDSSNKEIQILSVLVGGKSVELKCGL